MRAEGVTAEIAFMDEPQVLRRLLARASERKVYAVAARRRIAHDRGLYCGQISHARGAAFDDNPARGFAAVQSRRSGSGRLNHY